VPFLEEPLCGEDLTVLFADCYC